MFGSIGYTELLIIGVIALLLYGQRLPDVAKSWGNTYRDFRRSLNDLKSNIAMDSPMPPRPRPEATLEYRDREETAAPKFVPPPPEPDAESPADPRVS